MLKVYTLHVTVLLTDLAIIGLIWKLKVQIFQKGNSSIAESKLKYYYNHCETVLYTNFSPKYRHKGTSPVFKFEK